MIKYWTIFLFQGFHYAGNSNRNEPKRLQSVFEVFKYFERTLSKCQK
jgi:hypothetical protein